MDTVKKKGRPRINKEIIEKQKKPRGRKKKENVEPVEKVKNQRGRKNITNFYSTKDKKILTLDNNRLLSFNPKILEHESINEISNINDEINNINVNDNENENIVMNENWIGDRNMDEDDKNRDINKNDNVDDILLHDFVNTWPEKTDILCWWCCYGFDTVPLSLPLYLNKNNIYRSYGNFCSFACMIAFNNEKNITHFSNIKNLYYKLSGKYITDDIKPANERYVLKKFGGIIDIEDFRKNENLCKVLKYPLYMQRNFLQTNCIKDFKNKNKLSYKKISHIMST